MLAVDIPLTITSRANDTWGAYLSRTNIVGITLFLLSCFYTLPFSADLAYTFYNYLSNAGWALIFCCFLRDHCILLLRWYLLEDG